MKATALKETLQRALSVVERATAKNPSLPILGTIAILAQKNKLELAATDLEFGVRYRVLAQTEKEGGVAVPSHLLSQFVGLLPEKQVILAASATGLQVVSKEHKTLVKTLSLDDFPIIPTLQGNEKAIEVDVKTLVLGLEKVVSVTGQTQVRPEISGVYFLFQQDLLRLVATDSFRLAEKTLSFVGPQKTEATFILPQKTAKELVSIFGDLQGVMRIYISPAQVLFEYIDKEDVKGPTIQVVSRLIEGEYPQYQDVIPKDCQTIMVTEKAELISRLRAASLFSGKMNDVHVVLDPKKQGMQLSAKSSDVGEHSSLVPGKVQGKALEASFNWRFLLEGVSQIQSQELEIGFGGEDAPAVLRPIGQGDYLYVVMPVKV